MVINQEFVDKVLSRSKELFKFRDFIKFYPGRELSAEKALMFRSHELLMDYLSKNVLWSAEYYLICQRRSEVSFRLKEELMTYRMDDSGEFTLHYYEDRSVDESKIHEPIDRVALIRDLKYLIKKTSRRPKRQKKAA